ncbi:MAG: molybdenum cofactor biosynthesis protein MoaE [Nitrospirota bacterium]
MIRLLLFGALREWAGTGEIGLTVDAPLSVRGCLDRAEERVPGLRRWVVELGVVVAVNGDVVPGGEVMLAGGEEVALLPPFSGGAPVSPSVDAAVRFQAEPFSMDEEMAAVRAQSARIGAIVTMTGTVRDLSHGRAVLGIKVELYHAMARGKLAQIRKDMMCRHSLLTARIVVRHGQLNVGDDLILIIAAAEHRGDAFAAAHWCIDEIKRSVPIWKRELTPDGWRWVHGC